MQNTVEGRKRYGDEEEMDEIFYQEISVFQLVFTMDDTRVNTFSCAEILLVEDPYSSWKEVFKK